MKLLASFTIIIVVVVFAWGFFVNKEKEIIVAILIGSTTIGAALIGAALTHQTTKNREIEESHRLHKIEVYTEFSDLVVKIMGSVKTLPDNATPEDKIKHQNETVQRISDDYMSFSKKLLLWGSPIVVKKYEKFREYSQQSQGKSNSSGIKTLLLVDDVFSAMRNDLGLSNKGLERGDLLKLFLSDPGELDKILK